MSEDIHFLTVAEAARRMRAGSLSPVELCDAYLARIESLDESLRAFLTVTAEEARRVAAEAERAYRKGRDGPLLGVPFALKDVYDTAGVPTTGHSEVTRERCPSNDSACAAKLKAAGGVMLGKLATHEFSTGGPSWDVPWPPARNPWRLDRFPGGSSSGAGAAVAAGLIPAALGGDTGGSIRLPAAYCGLVGLKPTYGRVSKRGVLPLSWTLDNCGPLTWTVEDTAIVLQAIAGYDSGDPSSANMPVPDFSAGLETGIRGLKIGVVRQFYERDVPTHDSVVRAMDEAYRTFEELGAKLVEVELPPLDTYQACYRTIVMAEAYSLHEEWLRTRTADYGSSFRYRILSGALIEAADYVSALRIQRQLMQITLSALSEVDVLATATTPAPAPVQNRMTIRDSFSTPPLTLPFNIAQVPALSLCNGFSSEGLPLSMQIIGRPFEETRVLRVAAAYERATAWRVDRPKLLPPEENEQIPKDEFSPPHDSQYKELAERVGLELTGQSLNELSAVMPLTDELVQTVRAPLVYGDEPGPTFELKSEMGARS